MEEFCYLGNIINSNGGTEYDVDVRIRLSKKAFNVLNKIWIIPKNLTIWNENMEAY